MFWLQLLSYGFPSVSELILLGYSSLVHPVQCLVRSLDNGYLLEDLAAGELAGYSIWAVNHSLSGLHINCRPLVSVPEVGTALIFHCWKSGGKEFPTYPPEHGVLV